MTLTALETTGPPHAGEVDDATISDVREEPLLPEDLKTKWDELVRVSQARERASEELTKQSARARELVAELLQAGVDRKYLVDRPFSDAGLAKIQRELGLTRRQRRQDPE